MTDLKTVVDHRPGVTQGRSFTSVQCPYCDYRATESSGSRGISEALAEAKLKKHLRDEHTETEQFYQWAENFRRYDERHKQVRRPTGQGS